METALAQKELEESRGHTDRMPCVFLLKRRSSLRVRLGRAGHLRGGEAEGGSFRGRGQGLRASSRGQGLCFALAASAPGGFGDRASNTPPSCRVTTPMRGGLLGSILQQRVLDGF